MKHCDKCNVNVAGDRKICPLCQNVLTGTGEAEPYPHIPTFFRKYKMAIKIAIFSSITICIISLAVNYMIPQSGFWSWIVLLGIACLWVSMFIIIKKGSNIPKTIIYHVVALSAISVLWDKVTGWHGWSIDFVIPSVCIAAIIAMVAFIKASHKKIRNYVFFIFIDAIFGIIPLVLYNSHLAKIKYPSIICTALSIIIIVALLTFQGKAVASELKKKFHL